MYRNKVIFITNETYLWLFTTYLIHIGQPNLGGVRKVLKKKMFKIMYVPISSNPLSMKS